MAKDLVKMDAERVRRAYELDAEVGNGSRDIVGGLLRVGGALKAIRDDKLYVELGYEKLEDYAEERWGIGRSQMYIYVGIIERLPAAIVRRVGQMAHPVSMRRLTAIQIDPVGLSEGEIDELVGMSDEEFEQALLGRGYDRKKMGGRGPADLKRALQSTKKYRDQRGTIVREREGRKCAEAERDEWKERAEQKQAEKEQLQEAIKAPQSKKIVALLAAMQKEIAVLKEKEAEREAQISYGKEVLGRALRFHGEVIEICNRFFDETCVDTLAGWVEVRKQIANAVEYVGDLRGKMAEVLSKRMAEGEIEPFDLEDPEAGRALADSAMTPRSERRQREAG